MPLIADEIVVRDHFNASRRLDAPKQSRVLEDRLVRNVSDSPRGVAPRPPRAVKSKKRDKNPDEPVGPSYQKDMTS